MSSEVGYGYQDYDECISKMAKQIDELHTLVTNLMGSLKQAANAPGVQGMMVRQMMPPGFEQLLG